MNGNNFFNEISKKSQFKKGFYFEIFVQNLLKVHLEKQNKTYVSEYFSNNCHLDGYAEFGIDTVEEPVAFEIESISIINKSQTSGFINNVNSVLKVMQIKCFILICPAISSEIHQYILNRFSDSEIKIIIWDIVNLNQLIDLHRKDADNITNNLFKLGVENDIRKDEENNWEKRREVIIKEIREGYKKGAFSLFLGSGVSCSAGFPDWNQLLKHLYASYVNKEFNDKTISNEDLQLITQKIIDINNGSAIANARYLREGLSQGKSDNSFVKAIKEALYTNTNKGKICSSKLIDSITSLCVPKRTGANVRSIITYNFDDLLEEKFKEVNLEYHSICMGEEQYEANKLPIYHVHGFIPRNSEVENNSTLVFSEDAYHKVYSEPYHWSNLVQLTSLCENNCLMIGLSMTDPNLRRLLEIAALKQSGNERHYALMVRLNLENLKNANDNTKEINSEVAEKMLRIHNVIQEQMMKSLGVNIIWCNNYDEYPSLIDKIRN